MKRHEEGEAGLAPTSARGLVPVDLDVMGGAAGGDDVEFFVAIKIGEAEVFAGHVFVIDDRLAPALVRERSEGDNAAAVSPPPGDDHRVCAHQSCPRECVTFYHPIGQHLPL